MTQTTSPPPTPSTAFWPRFRDLGSLRRSTDHRAVAGVAEGLSRHFDIDPTIVRVLFAALTFFGGAGLILYLALWLTVPGDTSPHSIISGRLNRDPRAWTTIGLAAGMIFAAAALLGSLSWAVPHPFPFLLLALVLVLGLLALTRRGDRPLPMPTITDPAFVPDAAPPPSPSASREPAGEGLVDPSIPDTVTEGSQGPGSAQPAGTRAWWQRDDLPPAGAPVPPFMLPTPPAPRPRSHLFGLTLSAIALAIACVWVVDVTTSYDVNPSVYPGTALAVIALALLAGTWWGRARGLIALGVLASLLTAGLAFIGPGPYGDRSATPTEASRVSSSYTMGAGRFSLHLEQVSDVAALRGRDISIDQRFGQLDIVIPSSVTAVVDATVEHGEIDGPVGVQTLDDGGEHVSMTPADTGQPTITIHAHLEFGQIQIERAACPGAGTPVAGESTRPWKGDTNAAAACN